MTSNIDDGPCDPSHKGLLDTVKNEPPARTRTRKIEALYTSLRAEWKNHGKKDLHIEIDYERVDISFVESFNVCFIRKYMTSALLDSIIYLADIKDGDRVLDMGSGNGKFAVYVCQIFPNVSFTCVVNSISLWKLGQQNAQEAGVQDRIRFILQDFDEFCGGGEAPDAFTRIVFAESIGYSQDRVRLMRKCWSLLTPGGRMYIKSPCFVNEKVPLPLAERYFRTWEYDFSTVGTLERDLVDAGLRRKDIRSAYQHPFQNLIFMNPSDYLDIIKFGYKNGVEFRRDHGQVLSTFAKVFRFSHIVAEREIGEK